MCSLFTPFAAVWPYNTGSKRNKNSDRPKTIRRTFKPVNEKHKLQYKEQTDFCLHYAINVWLKNYIVLCNFRWSNDDDDDEDDDDDDNDVDVDKEQRVQIRFFRRVRVPLV